MKTRFVSCEILLVILLSVPLGSLTAGSTARTVAPAARKPAKKKTPQPTVLSREALALLSRVAATSPSRYGANPFNSWWSESLNRLEPLVTGRRPSKVRALDAYSADDGLVLGPSTDTISAPALAASAVNPQPDAVGGTLTVDGTRNVATDDAYKIVQVGVTQSGVINHTAGTFSIGTTSAAGEIDLGYASGKTGTYNISGSAILNVVGDLYVGGAAGGTFSQTGGTVSITSDGITLGSSDGSLCTYSISLGSLNTQFLVIGDTSVSTFTQTGGTVTVGANPVAGSNNNQRFQFGGLVGDTYQLTGGTLSIPNVYSQAANTGTFNFNGGVLQAVAQVSDAGVTNPVFMAGLLAANVQAGGAKIDTNGLNITIAQPLVHSGTGTDGGLTKQTGAGTLTLTASSNYTGLTTVSAGVLQIDNNSAATPATTGQLTGTTGIVLNNGGTLLLSGSAAVTDRLNNAAPVTINGGGKLSTGGLNEGTRPATVGGGAVGLGALTLATTSSSLRAIIDFGSTQTGSALVFSSLAASGKSAFVTILNYTGAPRADSGAATNDRLLFTTDPGFTAADLANWQFSNDTGIAYATGGLEIAYNGYFEIVPVPEPATWLGSALLLGTAGTALRRRLRAA